MLSLAYCSTLEKSFILVFHRQFSFNVSAIFQCFVSEVLCFDGKLSLVIRMYHFNIGRAIESFSFKLRMLHDAGMIHSQYIHDAFQVQVVTAQYIFLYLPRQVF